MQIKYSFIQLVSQCVGVDAFALQLHESFAIMVFKHTVCLVVGSLMTLICVILKKITLWHYGSLKTPGVFNGRVTDDTNCMVTVTVNLFVKDKYKHKYKQMQDEYTNIIVKKMCIFVTHDQLRSSGMITRYGWDNNYRRKKESSWYIYYKDFSQPSSIAMQTHHVFIQLSICMSFFPFSIRQILGIRVLHM